MTVEKKLPMNEIPDEQFQNTLLTLLKQLQKYIEHLKLIKILKINFKPQSVAAKSLAGFDDLVFIF